jgi:hypothetical protein
MMNLHSPMEGHGPPQKTKNIKAAQLFITTRGSHGGKFLMVGSQCLGKKADSWLIRLSPPCIEFKNQYIHEIET